MIPRYSRPEMTAIWSEQSRFQIWFEIEAIVEVPVGVDPAKIGAALQFWTSGKDERASLIFDKFTSNVNSNV